MKLSVWRQFSSNHSSRFTVVGVFKTAEEARKAADTLESVRLAANEWLEKPENEEIANRLADGGYLVPPTPPEQELVSKLGIEMEVTRAWDLIPLEEGVPYKASGRVVFINGRVSAFGAQPFDAILRKMGADVYVDGILEPDPVYAYLLSVTVTCAAPDEGTAGQLAEEYGRIFRKPAQQDGKHLKFVEFDFYAVTLIDILRDRGCTDIQYEFIVEQDD